METWQSVDRVEFFPDQYRDRIEFQIPDLTSSQLNLSLSSNHREDLSCTEDIILYCLKKKKKMIVKIYYTDPRLSNI